jgi:hypothetical protein
MEELQVTEQDQQVIEVTGEGIASAVRAEQAARDEQTFYSQGLDDYVRGRRDTEAAKYWISKQT